MKNKKSFISLSWRKIIVFLYLQPRAEKENYVVSTGPKEIRGREVGLVQLSVS